MTVSVIAISVTAVEVETLTTEVVLLTKTVLVGVSMVRQPHACEICAHSNCCRPSGASAHSTVGVGTDDEVYDEVDDVVDDEVNEGIKEEVNDEVDEVDGKAALLNGMLE